MTTAETAQTTQVYRIYIKATPEAIWDAITKPEWTERYGYAGKAEYDLRPGGAFRTLPGDAMADFKKALDSLPPDQREGGPLVPSRIGCVPTRQGPCG